MATKVRREQLLELLKRAKKAADNQHPGVCLHLGNDTITLAARSCDLVYRERSGTSPCKVTKEDAVTIQLKRFLDITNGLTKGCTLSLSKQQGPLGLADHLLVIESSDGFRVTLQGDPVEDEQLFEPKGNGNRSSRAPSSFAEMPASVFLEGLSKTSFAMSKDESRANIMCVLLKTHPSTTFGTEFVTTDGHRLARYQSTSNGYETPLEVRIPSTAIPVLQSLPDKEFLTIETFQAGRRDPMLVVVRWSTGEIAITVEPEQYPDYKKVLPTSFSASAEIDSKELVGIIKTINKISDYKKVDVVVEPGSCRLKSVGETLVEKPVVACWRDSSGAEYHGEHTKSRFDSVYLIEGLKVAGMTPCIQLSDKQAPLVISSEEPTSRFTYLVMPVMP